MNLLSDIQRDTPLRKVAATHGGEWAGPCPFCGGEDRFHVQPAENRWLCRGCTDGKWKSPYEYYRRRGDPDPYEAAYRATQGYAPAPRRQTPRRDAFLEWSSDPWPLIRQFEGHPQRFELWRGHKPLSRETIQRMHLGVGVLPACSCRHPRLIVPVLEGSMVLGLRGRRLDCNCPQKWHQSAGTTLERLPLYNQDALLPSPGRPRPPFSGPPVLVVENCIDALLLEQFSPPFVGVATYSVSYWKDAWLEPLFLARPEVVMVAYDHDLAGNGGGERREELIAAYRARHPGAQLPPAAGPRLVRRLQAAGLKAELFDWGEAPLGMDVGRHFSENLPKKELRAGRAAGSGNPQA